jgi:hypothetical protein
VRRTARLLLIGRGIEWKRGFSKEARVARVSTRTWQVILGVGAVLLLIGMFIMGQWITGIAALILLLAMAGGALMYRFMGPPER